MAITRSSRDITSTERRRFTAASGRSVALVGLVIVGAAASSGSIGAAPRAQSRHDAGAATTSFFEPFDRLNTKRWLTSDGWVDGDQQGCAWSRDNVSIQKGVLQLRLGRGQDRLRAYRCGELQSVAETGYGVYEARIRTAAGSGLNTAMFTYDNATRDEIDFEFLGRDSRQVQLNYFSAGKGGHETLPALGFDAAGGFHDYALDWGPGRIRWYVDGKLVREATGSGLPSTPGHMILSLWNGSAISNAWLGAFDSTRTPVLAEVDWAAYTRQGERCRFPQSITCKIS